MHSMATKHHQSHARPGQESCSGRGELKTCCGVALARQAAACAAEGFAAVAGRRCSRRRRRRAAAACQGRYPAGAAAVSACCHLAAASEDCCPFPHCCQCASRCMAPSQGCGCARAPAVPAAAMGTSADITQDRALLCLSQQSIQPTAAYPQQHPAALTGAKSCRRLMQSSRNYQRCPKCQMQTRHHSTEA
jgi:hypothetical protein